MRVLTLLIALLMLTCFTRSPPAQAQAGCTAAEGESVVLGLVAPPQVVLTAQSSSAYVGAEAMRRALNACGGVDGRPLEWQYVPASDRDDAQAAVETLVQAGVPLIAGGGLPSISTAASQTAAALGVVYWELTEPLDPAAFVGTPCTLYSGEMVTDAARCWVYTPRPTLAHLGRDAADLVAAQLGADAQTAVVYTSEAATGDVTTLVGAALSNVTTHDLVTESRSLYDLAVQLRETRTRALITGLFESQTDALWYDLREANANLDLWLHVGTVAFGDRVCATHALPFALITVNAGGSPAATYDDPALEQLAAAYRAELRTGFGGAADRQTHLAASGVLLLARHILPHADALTPEGIRLALAAADVPGGSGLFGEGVAFAGGFNQRAVAVIEQQQGSAACTLAPDALATCLSPDPIPFPTWRERTIATEDGLLCGAGA